MQPEDIEEAMSTVTLTNAKDEIVWSKGIDVARFEEASKAAESWVNAIAEARHFIEIGEPRATIGTLLAARLSYDQHSELIEAALPQIVAEGPPIQYHGPNRV